jgi:putative ABC transport system permease protein
MIVSLAIRNLFRNPRRSFALLLTVACGSASLFLFQGFNHGIMNQYKDNTIHSRYGHGQINTAGYRDKVLEKPWESWITNFEALSAKLKSSPGVRHVFPRIEFFGLLTNGRITVSGRGQGIDGAEEAVFFNTLNVEEGETLSKQEDGILLGRGLARALDVKPGDRVTILSNTIHGSMNAADFVVTGLFHTGQKDFDDTMFRIQISQAQTLLDTDKVESIALGLTSDGAWSEVAGLTKTLSSEEPLGLEATPFAVLDKVYYQHSVDWLNQQFHVIQLIILSIVILGIFNTVSNAVLERKPEIGNLRANGESPSDVMKLLNLEGLVVGLLGASIGILFALVLNFTLLRDGILMPPAPGLTRQFHVLIEFLPAQALWAFALNSLTTVIGTGLAAWKVARMPIADALRST